MVAVDQGEVQARADLGRVLWAAFVGGGIAGACDITYAFTAWGERGVAPLRVLQSVASGLLGREAARAGGIETGLLGAGLHFGMTFVMGLVFALAYLALPALRRGTAVWGLAYGGAIYLVMNFIVVPLSNAPKSSGMPSLEIYFSGLAVHVFLVGLPIALIARATLERR